MIFVQQNALIKFVPFSVQQKYTNGKACGCKLVMRAVTNAAAAGLAARTKISNGNIQKAGME
jgi:hypothetical protein